MATAFAELGFDVDIGPLFATPDEVVRAAIENDVDVVGLSSLAAGHLTLAPQIIAALRAHNADDVTVIVGGVVSACSVAVWVGRGCVGGTRARAGGRAGGRRAPHTAHCTPHTDWQLSSDVERSVVSVNRIDWHTRDRRAVTTSARSQTPKLMPPHSALVDLIRR